jgi:hypothetical protein
MSADAQAPVAPAPPSVAGPTIDSYFLAFAPALPWEELWGWPPDVFALANLVLDQTEAYRFAVSPAPGRRWPPAEDWNAQVVAAASAWRAMVDRPDGGLPAAVARPWDLVRRHRGTLLRTLRDGDAPDLCEALLTLHAMADEACHGLADPATPPSTLESRAWDMLVSTGSLSRMDPARVRITPKTHFGSRGITIRSLSRYLSLSYVAIDVHWRRIEPARWSPADRRQYRLLLLPWPLELAASAFGPVAGPLGNMDPEAFGFFEFDPDVALDLDLVEALVDRARRDAGRVDAVVLPECAVAAGEVGPLEDVLASRRVNLLVTGVREPVEGGQLGRNYVHLGLRRPGSWQHFEQAKHHRWCLDGGQIRQYHLSHVLDPAKRWWEAIRLPVRTAEIIDIGGGATIAPLVCEDLARLDEVSELMRQIGPSIVITLLLDGPQLAQRWPSRYAGVLADEPGSAVLTLTALGMAVRSQPCGTRRSRAVGMWTDPVTGFHQLDLAPGAAGLLITTAIDRTTVWTADGRRHEGTTPSVTLTGVEPVRAPATTHRAGRRRHG